MMPAVSPIPREIPLHGGVANRGCVFRVGDTVRRPLRPNSAATHALLLYLEEVGFEGAPRFLGIDDRDREVLSFVDGVAATYPHPQWSLSDEALVSVAALLRRFHDAVAAFDPAPYTWDRTVPNRFAGELVCHNDPNLDNVVFRDGEAVGLIDFDLAAPGSRLWDVAAAVRLWAPLRDERDIDDIRRGRSLSRLRRFIEAYGTDLGGLDVLVEAVWVNHDWLYDVVRDGVSGGNPGFIDYWTGGAERREERTRHWYRQNGDAIQAALA